MIFDVETALILGLLVAVIGALLAFSLATDSEELRRAAGSGVWPVASVPEDSERPGATSLSGGYRPGASVTPRTSRAPRVAPADDA